MRRILLQTMPHTGTHMMHYLFSVLGGIEVVWHHWEPNAVDDIMIAMGLNWGDFVFVRTYRDPRDTLASYESRATDPETGMKYYLECVEVCHQHMNIFPTPCAIHLDESNAEKTGRAVEIFRRCGVEPPEAAINYMKTWKRIASQHDKEVPSRKIKQSIHEGRVEIWHTK